LTADLVKEHVAAHYAGSEVPLLLSELGKELRAEGRWPTNETRSLAEIVEGLGPDITIVRDPETPAYVIVVPADKKHLAEQAIEQRHSQRFLANLARPVLLAFCVKTEASQAVHLRTTTPFRYHVGEPPDEPGFVCVEPEFRSLGIFVRELQSLSPGDSKRLAENITRWARSHDIAVQSLFHGTKVQSKSDNSRVPLPQKVENALARLYAAQPPGLASRMVVPLDIALYLSRLP
jgi:hypothetical protein